MLLAFLGASKKAISSTRATLRETIYRNHHQKYFQDDYTVDCFDSLVYFDLRIFFLNLIFSD